jgi:hypothetical protein
MEDAAKLKKQLTLTRVAFFILLALCFLFFIFAYVQRLEAEKQMELAVELKMLSDQARADAERQHMISIQARDEAIMQKMQSEEYAARSGEKLETVDQLKKELEVQRRMAEQQKELAIRNAEIARQNEARAIIAKNAEIVANKALEDCKKKPN